MASDLEDVIDILTIGFGRLRDRSYWANAIRRLSEHPSPPGLPKYGLLLESSGILVGVILLIFGSRVVDGTISVRCNSSSLYVAPAFRSFAPLLVARATAYKGITYLNVTPAKHTWPMIEALGYSRFSSGLFLTMPALCRSLPNVRVRMATSEICRNKGLQQFEAELLLAHANYGCMSIVCEFGGTIYPFVFGLRRKYGLPLAHLIYCRNQKDFIWLAGTLGRFLIRHGFPLVVLDADGPVRGLIGRYMANRPKYWTGPERPRSGDLSYTEIAMFGL